MPTALSIIMIVIAFIVLSFIVYLYLERTKKTRIKRIKKNQGLSTEDEAYNKVKRTKGVAKMMKRKGEDTESTDEMVDRAERALQKGEVEQAKDLATKAKNNLSATDSDMKKSNEEDDVKRAYTADELEDVEFQESKEAQQKREELEKQKETLESLPDNYLESKFELKVAQELIDEKEHDEEAKQYYAKAQESFDEEDFTQSLKYSIKCKKLIEGEDDVGLIAGKEIEQKEGPPEEVKEKFPDLVGEHETASTGGDGGKKSDKKSREEKPNEEETFAAGEATTSKICPECGFEGGEEDSYCPKCGIELVMQNKCPECGNKVEEDDEFCRNCGASLSESELACPECGAEVEADDDFCPSCGIEFE